MVPGRGTARGRGRRRGNIVFTSTHGGSLCVGEGAAVVPATVVPASVSPRQPKPPTRQPGQEGLRSHVLRVAVRGRTVVVLRLWLVFAVLGRCTSSPVVLMLLSVTKGEGHVNPFPNIFTSLAPSSPRPEPSPSARFLDRSHPPHTVLASSTEPLIPSCRPHRSQPLIPPCHPDRSQPLIPFCRPDRSEAEWKDLCPGRPAPTEGSGRARKPLSSPFPAASASGQALIRPPIPQDRPKDLQSGGLKHQDRPSTPWRSSSVTGASVPR